MALLGQTQTLVQQQKLSPQQIQMIKLLELPAALLEQRIKQEIEENIVLEEDASSESLDDNQPKEISVEEYLREDETPSYKSRLNHFSKDDRPKSVQISGGRSLQESLIEQLGYRNLSDRELRLAAFIVGSIDSDGYLRRDLQSVSDDIAFSLGVEATVEELERLLKIVQHLEPVGVGARDLRESLLLQLDGQSLDTPSKRLAHTLLDEHFDEFVKKHYERLMARLGVDEEAFRSAVQEIQRLSPKPGNLFSEEGVESAPYIIPDFILEYHDGQFDLSLNSYNIPELKINRRYLDIIRTMAGGSDARMSEQDKEAVQFVKSKIDSAKWFMSAIKQRHDTLMRTMQTILDYQRDYFKEGDRSLLRPMILKDIADRTGLDVSTISRVVNSKYVQTSFGIILLKSLFSEAMQTVSGEEVSSYEIKNILQECIDNENKRRPLTDEQLMDILNAKGYRIARRTVAKYREMLGISVARLRKEI